MFVRFITMVTVVSASLIHVASAEEKNGIGVPAAVIGGVLIGGTALAITSHHHKHHHDHDDATQHSPALGPGPVLPAGKTNTPAMPYQIGGGTTPYRQSPQQPTSLSEPQALGHIGQGVTPAAPNQIGSGAVPYQQPSPQKGYSPYSGAETSTNNRP